MTDTFDFVVVGGGSGGCTVAGRLSEDPGHVGGGAGRRRQERQLGGHHAVRAGADGRRQRQQLGLQHRAAKGPQRPHRLSAARQGARRLVRHQRDGLYPRPPRRLRPMGLARQCRLVVRRRAALLQARREQRRFRRRVSRQGRAARRQQVAHRQSGAADFSAGRAGSAVSPARGFQCRRARRPRHLSADAEERRTLQRRARLSPSAHGQPRQSARRDPRPRHPHPVRRQARGRRRIPPGQGAEANSRPARGDRLLRRVSDAAVADALRRRRQRGAWQARHRHRASSARRRTEPAGSPGFRVRLHVRQSQFQRHFA